MVCSVASTPNPMKILFIASDTNALGGIQQYNRKFINALRERGDTVFLVELKSGGFMARVFFVLKSIATSIFFKSDITICAHINYAPIGLFLKKSLGRNYIVCTHGIDVWDIKSPLKLKAMREAKLITTVAEFTRDKIISQLPETKNLIHLLHNPIDGSLFMPGTKSPDLVRRYGLKGKKVVLTAARLSAKEGYKGYDRVIEAMPEVLRVVPSVVYLLVGDGDDVPRVKRIVSEMGLEDKIILPGAYPNEKLPGYYNLADVFVMPSKAEGAPAVFVEALACGIPVIAGNKDGSATPLQGGEVGLLIDPESVSEIASAIINVLTGRVKKELVDPDFLRRKTLERFGLDRFPQRVDEMIKLFLAS